MNADVKGLEVVVAAELSGDKVLQTEILDGQDIHGNNQATFKLPDRLTSKRFKFKLLYGATAYGYATDGDFTAVSTSQQYWQDVIDAYYAKYKGIGTWHKVLLKEAQDTGMLVIPSGRHFPITPDYARREPWPLTIIKNYPVQGFGADLVMLARLETRKRLRESNLKDALLISTIHDSIVVDCKSDSVERVGRIMFEAVNAVPKLCKQVFDYEFKLPLTSEVQYGPNKKEMLDLKM